jgi:hypothetical protein
MNPIALIQATDMTRRGLRGSGPDDAVAGDAERRTRRPRRRRRPSATDAAPRPVAVPAPVVTANLIEAQSGSDQCSMVAARRNPARA